MACLTMCIPGGKVDGDDDYVHKEFNPIKETLTPEDLVDTGKAISDVVPDSVVDGAKEEPLAVEIINFYVVKITYPYSFFA